MSWLGSDWPLIAACAVCFLIGAQFGPAQRRWRRKAGRTSQTSNFRKLINKTGKSRPASGAPTAEFDGAEQLRIVERASFTRRRLLNRGEARLLKVLDEACAALAPGWRVMVQVSLGEILASSDQAAYRAVNSKRVDLLLVDGDGHARHAIELQGSGHHLGPAATRDAIKKEALRRAGIGYAEVVQDDTPDDVRGLVAKLVARDMAAAR